MTINPSGRLALPLPPGCPGRRAARAKPPLSGGPPGTRLRLGHSFFFRGWSSPLPCAPAALPCRASLPCWLALLPVPSPPPLPSWGAHPGHGSSAVPGPSWPGTARVAAAFVASAAIFCSQVLLRVCGSSCTLLHRLYHMPAPASSTSIHSAHPKGGPPASSLHCAPCTWSHSTSTSTSGF